MGYGDVLLNVGLIDQIDNKGYKEMEDMIRSLIKQKKWHAAFQVLHQNIPRQSMFLLLTRIRRPFICSFVTDQVFDELLNGDQTGHPSMFVNTTGFRYYFNYLLTEMPSELGYYSSYIQLSKVRKAIHVGTRKWNTGDEVKKLLEKFYQQLSFIYYL